MRLASVSTLLFARFVITVKAVDTLQDGDDWNSGYNGAHSIDPKLVASDRFGVQWSFQPTFQGSIERFMAKPLIYTGRNGKKVLIAAASSNNVYVLDATTGVLLKQRQLRKPYTEPTLPCGDLIPHNGILGTPVIDSKAGTLYVYAKGYYDETSVGPFSSVFWLHALDPLTLEERQDFPVKVDGPATNDAQRYFAGGVHLQRPSLKFLKGVVYGAFGGGCGTFNQTGWIAAVNGTSGKVVQLFATQTGPQAPSVEGGFYAGGGGGSLWQSGNGFATDGKDRLFIAVGDGKVFDDTFPPAAGDDPGRILEGTILNLKVDPKDGSLTPQDHFRLASYGVLGNTGRDMGSGGVTILDPRSFSILGGKRLALAGGQSGTFTLLNLDKLGGYRQGLNATDSVLQNWPVPGNVPGLIYGSFATYPLPEGGYAYIKPVGLRSIYVYKFNRQGPEYFKLVAQSEEPGATAVGSGSPVVTTNKGRPGTGILWLADINQGLTAYHAVPQNGSLVRIPIPKVGRPKFQRPVFNNNQIHLVTADGFVVSYGKKPSSPSHHH